MNKGIVSHILRLLNNVSWLETEVPFVIVPLEASIIAASAGGEVKLKVPPVFPVMLAVPPSHVGVKEKAASS